MADHPARKKIADTGESWLFRNPGPFRLGFHPKACRWCDLELDVTVIVGRVRDITTTCPYCDMPGPAIEGGPIR